MFEDHSNTSRNSPGRRAVLKALGTGAVGVAALPMLSACSDGSVAGAAGAPSLLPAPEQQVPPLLDSRKVR